MSISTQSHESEIVKELSNHAECPACGDVTDLDEHHWQYEPTEITVWICRSCHQYIHDDNRVREQGDDWQEECLERLAMLDACNNPGTGRLRERFNIPESI